ncbi:MAG: nitrogen regulation protein NR(I) [Acinetobacter sp.]|nr:nitrogen regulation protein NR(I) [Acinetobacter sp.]
MTKATVWVVDDDHSIRWVLEKTLQEQYQVQCFEDAQHALQQLQQQQPDVILSDIRMPHLDGLSFLSQVQQQYAQLPVIIMTAHSDLDSAVSSYQTGAFEYLPKPFDLDDVLHIVQRAIEHYHALQHKHQHNTPATHTTPSSTKATLNSTGMIGESPAMQEVFRAIGRLSQSHITVLINGESGTGKELVAHALHKHSPRSKQAFIALNMAAIPKDLIETELFGHEKGAFTGANSQRQGRFEQANGGTLFLDEIGDMPFETQTRLLRVLSDGEFYRVGGHTPVKVNVRIVAATHQNLEKLVAEGRFREDLFHRLNVIRIQIPRLADRREDIPMLAQYFLQRAAQEMQVASKSLDAQSIYYLQQFPWQGNVRQLENVCRWLTVMVTGEHISPSDLPQELQNFIQQTLPQQTDHARSTPTPNAPTLTANTSQQWHDLLAIWATQQLQQQQTPLLDIATPIFEKVLLQVALQHTQGHKQHAAELLGWGRNTLTRKLKELDLE